MSSLVSRGPVLMILAAVAVVAAGLWTCWRLVVAVPEGDVLYRQGEVHLSGGEFNEAIEDFDRALATAPGHDGALMGKARALIGLQRPEEAEVVLNRVIDLKRGQVEREGPAARRGLATAYGHRGIIRDSQGRYEQALSDYVEAMKIDAWASGRPEIEDRLYRATGTQTTLRDRVQYLYRQLQLPEEQRHLGTGK